MNTSINQKIWQSCLRKQTFRFFAVIAAIWLLGCNPSFAREFIQNFESDIWIHPDSSLTVRETITVYAEGRHKLSPGEKAVARFLFSNRRSSVKLEQGNHRTLQSAKSGLQSWLRTEFETIYFKNNTAYFVLGVTISAIVFGVMIATSPDPGSMAFIALWLSIWTIAIYFLIRRKASARGKQSYPAAAREPLLGR